MTRLIPNPPAVSRAGFRLDRKEARTPRFADRTVVTHPLLSLAPKTSGERIKRLLPD